MSTMTTMTSPATEEDQAKSDLLTARDRCDSCGAQAFSIAENDKSHDLYFCNHHKNKFEAQLIAQGFRITDESYKLNEKPSISANAE